MKIQDKKICYVITILSWIILTLSTLSFAGALPESEHIYVTGEGVVETVPDRVIFTLSLEKTHETLATAKDDVDQRAAALIALGQKFEIPSHDISAQRLSIYPDYSWHEGEKRFLGHRVKRTVNITLRNLERYHTFMQEMIEIGIDRLDDIKVESSQSEELKAQALEEAIKNAKQKAKNIAAHFDANVGTIFSISEIPLTQEHYREYEMLVEDVIITDTNKEAFLPGKVTITKKIYAVFHLEPKGTDN
jgi:uncharacterized protein YggE